MVLLDKFLPPCLLHLLVGIVSSDAHGCTMVRTGAWANGGGCSNVRLLTTWVTEESCMATALNNSACDIAHTEWHNDGVQCRCLPQGEVCRKENLPSFKIFDCTASTTVLGASSYPSATIATPGATTSISIEQVVQGLVVASVTDGQAISASYPTPAGIVEITSRKVSGLTLPLEGLKVQAGVASVFLPKEVSRLAGLANNETAVIVVTSRPPAIHSNGELGLAADFSGFGTVQVVFNASDSHAHKRPIIVSGLVEPIRITLPMTQSIAPASNMEPVCVAWADWHEGGWSDVGVSTSRNDTQDVAHATLECVSNRLTKFTAVWREIRPSLLCANLDVFSKSLFEVCMTVANEGGALWFVTCPGLICILSTVVLDSLAFYGVKKLAAIVLL